MRDFYKFLRMFILSATLLSSLLFWSCKENDDEPRFPYNIVHLKMDEDESKPYYAVNPYYEESHSDEYELHFVVAFREDLNDDSLGLLQFYTPDVNKLETELHVIKWHYDSLFDNNEFSCNLDYTGTVMVKSVKEGNIILRFTNFKFVRDYISQKYVILNGDIKFSYVGI